MDSHRHDQLLREALRRLVEGCRRLVRSCYWAGTSAVALEELGHRLSFDLDFHTRRALADTRPLLAEMEQSLRTDFRLLDPPDEFGSGFSGLMTLPGGEAVTIEVLSNFEDVPDTDLVPSRSEPSLYRVTLSRYLADKIQCVAERLEARDLVDIQAVLDAHPELMEAGRRFAAGQDALILAERLAGWTPRSIEEDLKAYPDVDPALALLARDTLSEWVRPGEESAG